MGGWNIRFLLILTGAGVYFNALSNISRAARSEVFSTNKDVEVSLPEEERSSLQPEETPIQCSNHGRGFRGSVSFQKYMKLSKRRRKCNHDFQNEVMFAHMGKVRGLC